MSVDASFDKGEDNSYVAIGVWGWKAPNMYLDFQLREKMGFTETIEAVEMVLKKYPAISAKVVEKKANGAAIIDMLHNQIGGFIPMPATESKEARAAAVTPFFQSKNVFIKTIYGRTITSLRWSTSPVPHIAIRLTRPSTR